MFVYGSMNRPQLFVRYIGTLCIHTFMRSGRNDVKFIKLFDDGMTQRLRFLTLTYSIAQVFLYKFLDV
jgi:hypothetical protein